MAEINDLELLGLATLKLDEKKADKTELLTFATKGEVATMGTQVTQNKNDVSNLKTTKADKTELSNYALKTEVNLKADKSDVTLTTETRNKLTSIVG